MPQESYSLDPDFYHFLDEGMPCSGESNAGITKLDRKDKTSRFNITMNLDIGIKGTYKDLRIRWATCWRAFGAECGYMNECKDKTTCPLSGVFAVGSGSLTWTSGPHITLTRVAVLVCQCQQWKVLKGEIGKTYSWENGSWVGK